MYLENCYKSKKPQKKPIYVDFHLLQVETEQKQTLGVSSVPLISPKTAENLVFLQDCLYQSMLSKFAFFVQNLPPFWLIYRSKTSMNLSVMYLLPKKCEKLVRHFKIQRGGGKIKIKMKKQKIEVTS